MNGCETSNPLSRPVRCIGAGKSQAGSLGNERNPYRAGSEARDTASNFLKTNLVGCACPTAASSWSCSANLSSGRVNDTIRSRLQIVRRHGSMPASGLRRCGDERRKSRAFLAHRREEPSLLLARAFLLVGTTNR